MADTTPTGDASPVGVKSQYTRNATGLVREVKLLDQVMFNAASSAGLGAALVVNSFALVVFPQSNLYVALLIAIFLSALVWTTFALMSATMPRVGGDYTYNSRILHPAIALGGNLCEFLSAALSIGFWGYWIAVQGLGPALTVIGGVTDNATVLRWGVDFSTDKNVIFITAALSVLLISTLAAFGTRIVTRVMTVLFLIALFGWIVSMVLLLFTSTSSFMHTVNDVAGTGAYQKTVAAGAKQGLYPDDGYSTKATFGALYFGLSATVWIWWGTYLSAEFRGAGQRARQLRAIVGTGFIQGFAILAGLVILLHTVGYDFFVSSLAGNFTGPGAGSAGTAGYAYFSALIAGSTPFVVLLALCFLGWWLPGLYINAAMPQRAILTWAFDSLLPRRLADVDERTHTPIIAIFITFVFGILGAAWTVYRSSTFFEIYTVLILFAFMPVLTTGLSAFLMKWRRPDLYKGSPAEWRLLGIEVLPVAGAGCFLVGALAVGLIMYFHEQLVPSHFYWVIAGPFIVFGIAAVWYFAARAFRRNTDGVDIALNYRVIPPNEVDRTLRFRKKSNGGSRTTTIFFATDVHGSDRCFRKFLNSAKAYDANVLVLGGDMAGKTLVPVQRTSAGWSAEVRDHSYRDLDEEGRAKVEQHILDLGMYPVEGTPEELRQLDDEDHREAAFVVAVKKQMRRWGAMADERLGDSGVRVFIAPGNDDPFEIDEDLEASATLQMAEDRCLRLDDDHEVITTGFSNPTPWKTPREATEEELAAKLDAMFAQVSDPERLVLVAHPPPRATELDQAPAITEDFRVKMELGSPQMIPVGSSAVREFIEARQPLLALHGHVHDSKGIQVIGRTVCINPGSEYSDGVLCGSLVRIEDARVVSRQLIVG